MLEVVRRIIIALCAVATSHVFAQQESASENQRAWQDAGSYELANGERKILLLEQQGFDLAVRVLKENISISSQEGPDLSIGTEVLVLENLEPESVRYTVQVLPVLNQQSVEFNLSELVADAAANSNTAANDWTTASALYSAAQTWQQAESLADDVIAPLELLLGLDVSQELGELLWRFYADALVRSGQSEKAIGQLSSYLADVSRTNPEAIYIHWQYLIALNQARYTEDALSLAEQLEQSVESLPPSSFHNSIEAEWLKAQVRNSLAVIQVAASRLQGSDALMVSAGELLRTNLQAVQDHPDQSLKARLTEYLAGYYSFTQGRSNSLSQQLLEDAESMYREAGDVIPISALRNNQAYAALGRGDFSAALDLYLDALALREGSKHEEGHAFIRARLGYLYFSLGDYRRARIRYAESISIYDRLGLHRQLVHNQLELAEVLRADGAPQEALRLLFTIEAQFGASASLEDSLRLDSQIAQNLIDVGNVEAASAIIQALNDEYSINTADGRERLEFASRLFYVLEFDVLRARLALEEGRLGDAASIISAARGQFESLQQEPLQQLELLHLQMQLGAALDEQEQLLATGREALALIDNVRNDVDFQFQGPRWSSRTAYIQALMIAAYFRNYSESGDVDSLNEAIALGQRSRALNLRQLRLASRIDGNAELTAIRSQVARSRQELASAVLAGSPTDLLERALARSEEDLQRIRNELSIENPQLDFLSRETIQQGLSGEDKALLYHLSSSESFLLVLSRDEHQLYPLPAIDEMNTMANRALEQLAIAGSDLVDVRTLASLMLPQSLDVSGSHLLIEADGLLTRIPFNVLLHFRDIDQSNASVTMLPSLSEYFGARNALSAGESDERISASERLAVAIVADPIINATDNISDDEGSEPQIAASANTFSEPSFPRLPYTQIEAQEIQNRFGEVATEAFLGQDATISNLRRSSFRAARILHIASHGFASEEDPLVLGLALANNAGNSVASGLLTAEQVSATQFFNELVVISACETGVGQALNGEPLMSIGRMFLASGAKAALTTLWPISDRANAEFMSYFYAALWDLQLAPPQALAYAQSELMQTPRYRHPFYWGAFQYQSVQHDAQAVLF